MQVFVFVDVKNCSAGHVWCFRWTFFSLSLALCWSCPKTDTALTELMSDTPSPALHLYTTFTDEIDRCSSHPPPPPLLFSSVYLTPFLDLSSVFHRYQKGIYAFGIWSRGDVWMFWSEPSLQPSECRLRPIDFCLTKGSDANLYGTHANTLEASTSCMIGNKRFPTSCIMWSCMCTIKTGFHGYLWDTEECTETQRSLEVIKMWTEDFILDLFL